MSLTAPSIQVLPVGTTDLGTYYLGLSQTNAGLTNAIYSSTRGTFIPTTGVLNVTATTAFYADLAENYLSDSEYAPGTVVVFGGENEITISTQSHDTRVAGVISTNPAYLMNAEANGQPVALQGRVPCLVQGPVNKGDVLVTGSIAGTAQKIINTQFQPGCVIGKSLEVISDGEVKLIEIVVGRT